MARPDRSDLDRRLVRYGTAGALLGAIAVAGAWLALSSPSRPRPGAGAVSGPAAVPVPAVGCGLRPGPDAVPTSTPAGVTWSLFGSGLEPFSPTAGPGVVEGLVARCYARTPEGAVFAAVQIPDRLSLAGPGGWEQIAVAQLVPGPGRDRFVDSVRRAEAGPPPATDGAWPSQVAGFRVVDYTPDRATVAVVYRSPAGVLSVSDVTVAWSDGDWKLAVLPDGTPGPPAAVVGSLDGYVEFRGV